jgi:hypothetical protein
MTITCPVNSTLGVCDLLSEVGAGLGIFFGYLGQSLPALVLILAVIGAVVTIFYAVAKVIGGSFHGGHGRRGM